MSKYDIHYGMLPDANCTCPQYGYYVTKTGEASYDRAFCSENDAFAYIMKLEGHSEYAKYINNPTEYLDEMYSQLGEMRMKLVDKYYSEYLTKQYIQQMKDNYFCNKFNV